MDSEGELQHGYEDSQDEEKPLASTSKHLNQGQQAKPKSSLKRKHSPHSHSPASVSTPDSRSLAATQASAAIAASGVAPLPTFTQHSAHLPPSDFTFYATYRTHPTNKQNYRYIPCGPSSSAANNPLPPEIQIHRYVESLPQTVRFSWEDRSTFVLITENGRSITAEKGWRAARANVPVREGNWYWEVKVDRGGGEGGRQMEGGIGEGSWCRVGVGRRESPLNAPVGFDGHSYAYRDKSGDAVTLSRPQSYGTAYGSGSTIGIYLSLPPRSPPSATDRKDPARIVRKRVPILYKGQLYFESLEYSSSKEMDDLAIDPATKAKIVVEEKKKAAPGTKAPPPVEDLTPPPRPLPKLEKSRIAFFLDGVCQGVAFEDIYDFVPLRPHPGGYGKKGVTDIRENWHDDGMTGYFPFVSVFGGAIGTINAGPDFAFPPPADIEAALADSPHPASHPPISADVSDSSKPAWKPLSDRYVEFLAEQNALDDADEARSVQLYRDSLAAAANAKSKRPSTSSSAPNSSSSTNTGPSKKSKLAAATTMVHQQLGAVKREHVQSISSPSPTPRSDSPAPSSTVSVSEGGSSHPFTLAGLGSASLIGAPLGSAGLGSGLREVVPESDGEDDGSPEIAAKEEDVEMNEIGDNMHH